MKAKTPSKTPSRSPGTTPSKTGTRESAPSPRVAGRGAKNSAANAADNAAPAAKSTRAPTSRRPAANRSEARYVARETPRDKAPADEPRHRNFLPWRRGNRRITVQVRSPALWLAETLAALGRRLWIVGKVLLAVAALVGAVFVGRLAVAHVVNAPRFAIRQVRVSAMAHVAEDDITRLAGVEIGDRLLAIDTDAVAARIAHHPWIVSAQVRRELPSTLVIDVTERKAAALAILGGLYLVDEAGHPFKRATLRETEGLVVITGIPRAAYADLREASEAALREALALLAEYEHPDSLARARRTPGGANTRPPLSEIHIDARAGYTLVLYDGGGQIRLGQGRVTDKLARLDELLADLGSKGIAALRTIHLDGPSNDRIPISFRDDVVAGESASPAR